MSLLTVLNVNYNAAITLINNHTFPTLLLMIRILRDAAVITYVVKKVSLINLSN